MNPLTHFRKITILRFVLVGLLCFGALLFIYTAFAQPRHNVTLSPNGKADPGGSPFNATVTCPHGYTYCGGRCYLLKQGETCCGNVRCTVGCWSSCRQHYCCGDFCMTVGQWYCATTYRDTHGMLRGQPCHCGFDWCTPVPGSNIGSCRLPGNPCPPNTTRIPKKC
jgi:hypothetical protein